MSSKKHNTSKQNSISKRPTDSVSEQPKNQQQKPELSEFTIHMIKNIGRPSKFNHPEELLTKAQEYIAFCDISKIMPTMSGFAVFCGTSRKVMCSYQEKEGFGNTIKSIRAICEYYTEQGMLTGKLNATGAIFSLKNNFQWKDKHEHDVNLNLDKMSDNEIKREFDQIVNKVAEKMTGLTDLPNSLKLPDDEREDPEEWAFEEERRYEKE